jgi:uncharacterized membrane protein
MAHNPLVHRLNSFDAHHRLGASLLVAIAALVLAWGMRLPVRIILAWNAYAGFYLLLAWVRILTAQPAVVVRLARLTHNSRRLILLFVMASTCASLTAVMYLLGSAKDLQGKHLLSHVGLGVTTVVLSWVLLHTIFTLQYAYMYYYREPKVENAPIAGGLIFPKECEPDYMDFAYFSFVIGMTSQVSDVQIGTSAIRRWALIHGVVSFVFNMGVLALGINIVSGLL